MNYVIPAPKTASVAVHDSTERFPIRRIYCIGRNYAAHAIEMGKDPEREPPFFFTKPGDAVIDADQPVPYPPHTTELHFEVELVIALRSGGKDLTPQAANGSVWGAGVGIDLTRRDVQAVAKSMGRPWDLSKGFDHSAILGALRPVSSIPSIEHGQIWLNKNGVEQQHGDLSEMIWPVDEHIALLSEQVELKAGDLIMTGTPAGVGATVVGDTLTAGIDGIGDITVSIVDQ